MKINSVVKFMAGMVLTGAMTGFVAQSARAQVLLNFDDIVVGTVEGQSISGAPIHAYLGAYGITFSSASGAVPAIQYGPPGSHVTAPSAPNYFSGHFGAFAYSWTLSFATPLTSLSFATLSLDSVSTGASWSATAYSAGNQVLSSVGNPFISGPGTPSATYTLAGPLIHHVDFFTNVQGFAGNELKIDNLALAPIPEPQTYAMLLAGLGLLGFEARRRRKQAQRPAV